MSESDRGVPWVLLRVCNQMFGVRATEVREMAEMPQATRLPNVPDYVLGLITLSGQVLVTKPGVGALFPMMFRMLKKVGFFFFSMQTNPGSP